MPRKGKDESSHCDEYDYADDYNDENDASFYDSAYREEEFELEDGDSEPMILLTTYSEDSEFVPVMTDVTTVKRNEEIERQVTRHQYDKRNGRQAGTRSPAAAATEIDAAYYEGGEEDEALVETVAMNFGGMSVSSRYGCCCFTRRSCCSSKNNNNQSCDSELRMQEIDIDNAAKPSNEKLLSIAFISFLAFTCCQGVAAFLAQSEAMMGDSVAMAVDAFTYASNLVAERIKNNYVRYQHDYHLPLSPSSSSSSSQPPPQSDYTIDDDDDDSNDNSHAEIQRRNLRSKRKLILLLELIPPLISVTTLIIVTAFILKKAITTLIVDMHRDSDQQSTPNVILMLTFSCLNLFVDVVNVFCFSKARHAMGYNTNVLTTGNEECLGHTYDYDAEEDVGRRLEKRPRQRKGGLHKQKINATKKKRPKQNIIGLAKEKITRSMTRNDSARYHLTTGDSSSNEDSQCDEDRHEYNNFVNEKGERITDEGNQEGKIKYNVEDDTKDLYIEGTNVNEKMKGMTAVKGEEQSQLDKRGKIVPLDCINNSQKPIMMENYRFQALTESQFAKYPFQKNESDREDEDEGFEMVDFGQDEEANLNMCSAYTHVFADTVRSVAVLVAAILAEAIDGITSEVADAAAAIAVSIIILLALIPLFVGIKNAWHELNRIWTEEANERNELLTMGLTEDVGFKKTGQTLEYAT